MIVVMKSDATEEEIQSVIDKIHESGLEAHLSKGEFRTIIGVIGDEEKIDQLPMAAMPGVEKVMPVMKPYKLVSREFHPENTVVEVGPAKFGSEQFCVIAGPCAIESEDQLMTCARKVSGAGAAMLRGGAFKPRTSPYSFQGLGEEGLRLLNRAKSITGLPVVTEVLDVRHVVMVANYVDMLQIGARNMQNFLLLREVGMQQKPVMLKRGMSATVEEWLMAAEYIVRGGNRNVILCERGIRTFETATRNTLDLSSVPIIKRLSHLPVIVDPSHATGKREIIADLAKAALAAGADGVMVEIHPDPKTALCDGPQALDFNEFERMMEDLKKLAPAVGRVI